MICVTCKKKEAVKGGAECKDCWQKGEEKNLEKRKLKISKTNNKGFSKGLSKCCKANVYFLEPTNAFPYAVSQCSKCGFTCEIIKARRTPYASK